MPTKARRVLVIGDLHTPFEHPDYLAFCKRVYKEYKCNHVIFIGDIVDNHGSSYHESDADGWSAGDELFHAKRSLAKWYKAFPKADVIIGNHEAIIKRKLNTAGLSQQWARSLAEVLEVPSWTFRIKLLLDDVLYIHGQGVTARTKVQRVGRSVVQGHRHTEGYVWYQPRERGAFFGMQVGTGIDNDSYAFAYAKDHPDPVLSCGVILEGKQAHVIPMIK